MTLECTSCRARYSIADSLIPPQGARIKCRKCGEMFTVDPPVIELAPSDLEVIPPPAPAPPAPRERPSLAPTPTPPAPPVVPPPTASPPFELETPVGSTAAVDAEPLVSPASAASPVGEMPAPDPGFERFGASTRYAAPPPSSGSAPRLDVAHGYDHAPTLETAPPPDPVPPGLALDAPPVGAPKLEPEPPPAPPAPAQPAPQAAAPEPQQAGTPIPDGLGPDERARHEKARRLARVLASDIAIYNREKRDRGIKDGNLVAVLGYEIKKSWEIYKERVTPEFANSTPYFRDALNEMLAEGKKIF